MCAVDTLRSHQHAIHLSGLVAGFVRVLGGWVFGAVFRLTMVLLLDWCVYMFLLVGRRPPSLDFVHVPAPLRVWVATAREGAVLALACVGCLTMALMSTS